MRLYGPVVPSSSGLSGLASWQNWVFSGMSLRLPADLLDRFADEATRLLALTYLDEIALAERRLADPQDAEALHDFRVALRRLRSCIRAYRNELKGSVSKRMRRSLRELMLVTNEGRDAEVHLEW